MTTILELGCGSGRLPVGIRLASGDRVVGVDSDERQIAMARRSYPERQFECAQAESLPFGEASFDCVISNLATSEMDIAGALAEAHRVLGPRGKLCLTVQPTAWALEELKDCRGLRDLFCCMLVLLNSLLFHLSGKALRVGKHGRSFQSERGMRLALGRAGFVGIRFSRSQGRLVVRACNTLPAPAAAVALPESREMARLGVSMPDILSSSVLSSSILNPSELSPSEAVVF